MVSVRLNSLVPLGLIVDSVVDGPTCGVVLARAPTPSSRCGLASLRLHSRYRRTAADLPASGRAVRLEIVARRFRRDVEGCKTRIFAERFGDEIIATSARRTSRLEVVVHHLGLALGGRPAEGFARRLMLPVSKDTLLRVVRRRSVEQKDPPCVVGIDDWAFRRNHRYGRIVCNLERRRVVALLINQDSAQTRLDSRSLLYLTLLRRPRTQLLFEWMIGRRLKTALVAVPLWAA
jgi:transposase